MLPNWWAKTQKYLPYQTFPLNGVYTWTQRQLDTINQATPAQQFKMPSNYNESISYDKGFFTKQLLEAVLLTATQTKDQFHWHNPIKCLQIQP